MDDETLNGAYEQLLHQKGISAPRDYIATVAALVRERAVFVSDMFDNSWFFFKAPDKYDEVVTKKFWGAEVTPHLEVIARLLESHPGLDADALKEHVVNYIKAENLKMGQVMNCIRLALVGESKGPDLFEIIITIGIEESISRIRKAIKVLG
jgi:glutamyl-tRNA synthetase